VFPKEAFVQELLSWDAREPGDAYRVLAGLPLPLYVTTDVDDLMVRALQELKKSPKAEICPWTGRLRLDPDVGGVSRDPSFDPTPGEPLVYYLHGHIRVPESIVLTDDDYFDFLVAVTRDERLLPPQIRAAVATTSLLFVGFNLTDLAYRVVNRGLVMTGEPALRRVSLIVQSVADAPASSYLEAYFGRIGMRVYWGSPDEFADELARRWEAYASHDA
jgi:hypothetical protein